jgi:RND family efflux transporter MFP subunit
MSRIALVLPLIALVGCATAQSAEVHAPAEAVPVTLAPVVTAPIARPVRGVGRVRAADEVALSFPFGGVVQSVRVDAGDRVHAGQILAVLDDSAARAQLAAADSAVDKARRDAERAAILEGTAASRQQREDAETGLAVAEAQARAASFQARRQAIVAPGDGIVLDVLIDADGTVAAGMPAIRFAGDGAYEMAITLASVDAVAVAAGDPASIELDAWPGEVLTGTVERRTGGAGPLGGWTVEILVDPGDHALASGLLGAATVTPTARDWTTIPLEAVAEADGDAGAVYMVVDGAARRVPIGIAFVAGDRVAVKSGLDGVDQVVADGLPFISEGALVAVGGAR